MIPMCAPETRKRLVSLLARVGLPTKYEGDVEKALSFVIHDKKCRGGFVEAIFVDTPGSFRIEKLSVSEFSDTVRRNKE